MFTLNCPHCGETLNIPEKYAGTTGTCNRCKGALAVPALGEPTEISFDKGEENAQDKPTSGWMDAIPKNAFQIQQLGCAMTGCGCLLVLFALLLAGLAGASIPVPASAS